MCVLPENVLAETKVLGNPGGTCNKGPGQDYLGLQGVYRDYIGIGVPPRVPPNTTWKISKNQAKITTTARTNPEPVILSQSCSIARCTGTSKIPEAMALASTMGIWAIMLGLFEVQVDGHQMLQAPDVGP